MDRLAALALLYGALLVEGELVEDIRSTRLVPVVTGADSIVTTPGAFYVKDAVTFEHLWRAHKGGNNQNGVPAPGLIVNPPRVDFRRQGVLAVFGGKAPDVRGYTARLASSTEEQVVIDVRPTILNSVVRLQAQPYAFFLLTRTARPVIVRTPDGQGGWAVAAKLNERPRKQ